MKNSCSSTYKKVSAKKNQHCKYCTSLSFQQKIILQKIYYIFSIWLKNHKLCSDLSLQPTKSPEFQRLILIINPHLKPKNVQNCGHQALIKPFLSRLNCQQSQFSALCQILADKLARKNFQIQTLVSQIKNAANSASLHTEPVGRKSKRISSILQGLEVKIEKIEQKEEIEQLQSQKLIPSVKTLQGKIPMTNQAQNVPNQECQGIVGGSFYEWSVNYSFMGLPFSQFFNFPS